MIQEPQTILVEGGRVYNHDGDTDDPPLADILIIGDSIAAIEAEIGARAAAGEHHPAVGGRRIDRVIDARDRLVIPGFVNAHYHAHDVLLKGMFETIPLDLWTLYALPPSYPRRSKEELRARVLVGAVECIRSGITTVQDMHTICPFHVEDLDTMIEAYDEVGLRCVFAPQFADIAKIKTRPYWDELIPEDDKWRMTSGIPAFPEGADIVGILEQAIKERRGKSPLVTFGIGPATPEGCSRDLLERIADLSRRENLPVYTHIYENRSMAVMGRLHYREYGGSLIAYLRACGLLGPSLTLAHSIWLLADEIAVLAETGTNVSLNPVGNLKTRCGVAPIKQLIEAGVSIAIGCDNCSCSDTQNMFQAMKLFTILSGITDPELGRPYAEDALRAATLGGARAANLDGVVGTLKPGHKADITIIDLRDVSYLPLNSMARQVVYTESGRGVETVIIGGRVVMEDRRILTVDEAALRRIVAEVMPGLRADFKGVMDRLEPLREHVLNAQRRVWSEDVGVHRHVKDDQFL